tara:strand:+ start:1104 stop:1796 length:693 start_codon:yes stop_codon:yes gene_type:complete
LFFAELPYHEIARAIGGIHILDLGCGVGKYAKMFSDLYGSQLDFSYLGVDQKVSEKWHDNSDIRCNFRQAGVGDIDLSLLDKANVIVSISVLEHLDHDLFLFQKISELQQRLGRKLLQIHLVPSAACLWLYGLHGVRQYTPRTINVIADAIERDTKVVVYALGGKHSNWVHWRNITLPLKTRMGDRRFVDTNKYCRDRNEAIAADRGDQTGAPSFYAILILPDEISDIEI